MSITSRPLSLYERYSLVRTLIGYPKVITHLVTYPNALPNVEFLKARVGELQALWPQLFARVEGVHTNAPRWVSGERAWAGEEVVFLQSLPTQGGLDERQEMLHRDLRLFCGLATRDVLEPLFRVSLYASTSRGASYLALSVNHLLVDGVGSLRLLHALLAPIIELKAEDIAPRLEDVVDTRLGYGTTASLAWSKVLQPKLPAWFQPSNEVLAWPGEVPSALGAVERMALLEVDKGVAEGLARVSKGKGLTLHPVLLTAWAWALVSVIEGGFKDEFSLATTTPRSERGTTHALGNFVSVVQVTYEQPSRGDTRNFWEAARGAATALKDVGKARQRMGMLAYVPNGANKEGEPTAWERFWLGEARAAAPFQDAFELSNLGRTSLPEQATALDWMHSAMPFGTALNVSAIGHENGMSVSVTWREGVATTPLVKEVEEVFMRVLQRLGLGVEGYERLTTL